MYREVKYRSSIIDSILTSFVHMYSQINRSPFMIYESIDALSTLGLHVRPLTVKCGPRQCVLFYLKIFLHKDIPISLYRHVLLFSSQSAFGRKITGERMNKFQNSRQTYQTEIVKSFRLDWKMKFHLSSVFVRIISHT